MHKDLEIEAPKYKLTDIERAKALETQPSNSTADIYSNPNNIVCCQNSNSFEICNNSKLLKKDGKETRRNQYIEVNKHPPLSSTPANSQTLGPAPHARSAHAPSPAGNSPTSTASGTQTTNYTSTTMKNGNSVGSSFASAVSRKNLTPAVSASTSTVKQNDQNVNKQIITYQEVGAAIFEVRSHEIYQIMGANTEPQNENGWESAKKRKRRRIAVGKN
ncbi:hypothetical protein JTB14_000587 [Gonioctena quinquepunctata]|nr:hypothetical protein JTB14_000587 [Gonioctena quinquepunctata]